ncbi:MAG: hypothetical protein ACXWAC_04720 [Usitatibacter sp.]
MKIRFHTVKRATWRNRFVEIAREVEGGSAPIALVVAAGLRARSLSRAAAFNAPRAVRPAA